MARVRKEHEAWLQRQGSSFKRQAHKDTSSKRQAPSAEDQAPSHKRQAP